MMPARLTGVQRFFHENQIMLILVAIVLGFAFPRIFDGLNAYATPLLITVFFTSSLRLTFNEIVVYGRDWRMLFIANAYMLVILPLALFVPMLFLDKDWATALLIVGTMPAGMTIALIADYFGGKTSLALVINATSSLLAPVTIPLVFKMALGQRVDIPMLQMFWSLFLTIVVPFLFAMLVRRAVPRFVERRSSWFREISLIAFGLLIAGIVADTTKSAALSFQVSDLPLLALILGWFGVLIWVSYHLIRWRTPGERITIALCMLYMNNTLALFVADKFFRSLGVVPNVLALLFLINLLLPILRIAAARVTHTHPRSPSSYA